MAPKLRISLTAGLLAVVLSAIGAVHAADLTQAADEAPATQPSCATTDLQWGDDETAALFGATVAVNGQTALVGIPGFSTAFVTPPVDPPYIQGRVAVFTCEATTQTWTRTASIQLPATEANQQIDFGVSTALQGHLAAIGARYGVYVYKRQGSHWNPVVEILPKNPDVGIIGTPAEQWGSVIAFKNDVLAVAVTEIDSTPGPDGIGYVTSYHFHVDLYQIVTHGDGGAAIRIARLNAPAGDTGIFGASLAFNGDTLVVGDPPNTTAYLYKRHGLTFSLDQTLTAAEATPNSAFGLAAAISKDVILIGAPDEDPIFDWFGIASEGAVYAFRHESGPGSPWVETQHFNAAAMSGPYAGFGASLAVNRHGQAVIGTPSPYDDRGTEYGPTFLYTLQGSQFVLSTATRQLPYPATSLGITDEYLIRGFVANTNGGDVFSGASIINLNDLPAN